MDFGYVLVRQALVYLLLHNHTSLTLHPLQVIEAGVSIYLHLFTCWLCLCDVMVWSFSIIRVAYWFVYVLFTLFCVVLSLIMTYVSRFLFSFFLFFSLPIIFIWLHLMRLCLLSFLENGIVVLKLKTKP